MNDADFKRLEALRRAVKVAFECAAELGPECDSTVAQDAMHKAWKTLDDIDLLLVVASGLASPLVQEIARGVV